MIYPCSDDGKMSEMSEAMALADEGSGNRVAPSKGGDPPTIPPLSREDVVGECLR